MVWFSNRSKKKSERDALAYAFSTATPTSGALPIAQPTTPLPLPTTTRAEKRCKLPPLVTLTVRFTSTTCMSNSRPSGAAACSVKPGRVDRPLRIWFNADLHQQVGEQSQEHTLVWKAALRTVNKFSLRGSLRIPPFTQQYFVRRPRVCCLGRRARTLAASSACA